MADLSPQAQAVFHAFNSKFDWIEDGVPGPQFNSIAAALRAAALYCKRDRVQLVSLADELEGSDGDQPA